jgi:hypothetical protein
MALRGNLADFTIVQLLNLVNLAAKTGTLSLERPGDVASIAFREGKLSFASYGQEDGSLAAILRRTNRISPAQQHVLVEKAAHMSDKELGLLLINAGYVTKDEILASLQQYYLGIIRRLFGWVDGKFFFNPNEQVWDGKITLRIELENIIIEGARQFKETEQLLEEIPSLEMALKFMDRPRTNIRNISLSLDEWKVISYVNPKNSIRQIARTNKMNDIEIRKIVYGLLQGGLVEIVRKTEMAVPPTFRMFPTQDKNEQKFLVNRLIDRIRSI